MKILMRADTHYSIVVSGSEYVKPKYTFSQVLAAVAVSMGSMVVGYSTAYTSPALVTMENSTTISVTEEQASWVGGLMPLAALAGGVLGGPLVDYIGRRKTILLTAVPFFVGWILIATARIVHLVLIGRAICGLCVGIGSLAFPASWVGGLMPLAALAGGVLGGPLVDYIGRRKTILLTAVPFFVGWILIATARIVHLVLIGRAICGLCVGIGSLAFPVYLGETIQPEVRGTLGLFPTAIGNIGILICYIAGKYLDWSQLAYLGASLPIPFLILMFMIPETPRWYMLRGRNEEARKALQWLRGKNTKIDNEMRDIALSDAEVDSDLKFKDILKMKYLKSILIALGLMLFQQLSGINAVIFYTVKIFNMSGSSVDGNLSTIIVGLVNFISTFVATALIDRTGRKILLYISSVTMTVTLIVLGTFFYVRDTLHMNVTNLGWLPLTSVMFYLLGFSLAFGPIPWLMMGEILPAKIRGGAASMITAFNWLCTFAVTKTFHNILVAIGPAGTFWLFGCICFVGLFFVIVFVPETRGKSLEQIENKMTGTKARSRRMSSIANIKPLPNGC
ncbi:sugar transporter [Danaus plexippus plexippus]|uniref:Sugar transporter n=1 Tax=Danaus plexippus plexippus TaxID=278856 RepID=A0A212FB95_DANPL|nr:sugar transporter [Danaus plexippus plexippus]